jgi:hypothetical protein
LNFRNSFFSVFTTDDRSSGLAATRRVDCNRGGLPPFAAAHDFVTFGYHAKSELFARKALRPFIRRAIYLEAKLNVKREMSESLDKAR